jgi:DNA-binding transcriptional MerR regulator
MSDKTKSERGIFSIGAKRNGSVSTVTCKKPVEADVASSATTRIMEKPLDISDVVRRTGLTPRALRFYEARGLVRPLRTASGRRLYGPGELARINQVVALKGAGFSLADIGRLLDRKPQENWKKVADRYFSPEEQARWAERMPQDTNFDNDAYNRQWGALGEKVAPALALDPTSDAAQALFDEWQALLAPFTAVAAPEMTAGATKLYDRMGEWQGEMKPPLSMDVWQFIKAAGAARRQRVGSGSAPE